MTSEACVTRKDVSLELAQRIDRIMDTFYPDLDHTNWFITRYGSLKAFVSAVENHLRLENEAPSTQQIERIVEAKVKAYLEKLPKSVGQQETRIWCPFANEDQGAWIPQSKCDMCKIEDSKLHDFCVATRKIVESGRGSQLEKERFTPKDK